MMQSHADKSDLTFRRYGVSQHPTEKAPKWTVFGPPCGSGRG